jgi:branched-chain amino acid transport system substrate-binding protein
MLRSLINRVAGFGLLTLAIGLPQIASAADDIIIASANPMTGNSAQFGKYKVQGIQLALDEANAAGGISGSMLKLTVEDDQGNPKEAAVVAQRIISDDKVAAVIGHWNSSCTLAAGPIYDQAGIPAITDAINRKISGSSKWMFRISQTDLSESAQLADYMVDKLGGKRIAVLYSNNDYGKGLSDAVSEHLKKRNMEVVASDAFLEGSNDFTPQISAVQAANPDVLFIGGYYREGALILQQARRMGFNVPVVGTDGFTTDELIKLGGESVEGVIFPGFFFADARFAGSEKFVAAYKAKYNEEPESYAALAYDSANMIIAGLKAGGGTPREAVQKHLDSLEGFQGVSGKHTFDEAHDTQVPLIMLAVKDGKIVLAPKQIAD